MSKPFVLPPRRAPYPNWSADTIETEIGQYGPMRSRSMIAVVDAVLVSDVEIEVDADSIDFANMSVAAGLVFA